MPDPYELMQQNLRDAFGEDVESIEDVQERFMEMLDKHDASEDLREITKEALGDLQGEMQKLQAAVKVQNAMQAMSILSDDERMEVINLFCKHCGSINPECQCWNDE